MNGRRAKKLRRAAEAATTGLPAVAYKPAGHHPRAYADIKGDPQVIYVTNPVEMAACTRMVYQRLKRGAKPGQGIPFADAARDACEKHHEGQGVFP